MTSVYTGSTDEQATVQQHLRALVPKIDEAAKDDLVKNFSKQWRFLGIGDGDVIELQLLPPKLSNPGHEDERRP